MKPQRAATSATVSPAAPDVGGWLGGQHGVREVETAGQDVPGDGRAVGGEDAGELALAEPDRGGDLLRAKAGAGEMLLDITARGGPVGGRRGRVPARRQDGHQVKHRALVGWRGRRRPGRAPGQPGQGAGVGPGRQRARPGPRRPCRRPRGRT